MAQGRKDSLTAVTSNWEHATNLYQAENIRKTLSSQLISADTRVSSSGRSIGGHGKEETLTGHDGMR